MGISSKDSLFELLYMPSIELNVKCFIYMMSFTFIRVSGEGHII